MYKIPHDLYWVMIQSIRDDEELDDLQKITSFVYTIGFNGYEIAEIELIGLLNYAKIDSEAVKPYLNRIFCSGVLTLLYPTGEYIDPSSHDYIEGIPDPVGLKQDIEFRIQELISESST